MYLPEPATIGDAVYTATLAQTDPAVGDLLIDSGGNACTVVPDETFLPEEDPNLFCLDGQSCATQGGSVVPEDNSDEAAGLISFRFGSGIGACATSMPAYYDWIMENSR